MAYRSEFYQMEKCHPMTTMPTPIPLKHINHNSREWLKSRQKTQQTRCHRYPEVRHTGTCNIRSVVHRLPCPPHSGKTVGGVAMGRTHEPGIFSGHKHPERYRSKLGVKRVLFPHRQNPLPVRHGFLLSGRESEPAAHG